MVDMDSADGCHRMASAGKKRSSNSDRQETQMAVLKELLNGIDYECVCGTTDRKVTDIVYDSRRHSRYVSAERFLWGRWLQESRRCLRRKR